MKLHKITAAILSSHFLFACGGSTTALAPEQTIPSTPVINNPVVNNIVKTGVITGFGSIYLDGQRYLTDTASFTVNGQSGQSIDQLQVGMKVSINVQQSDDDTPSISAVYYENDIEGTVSEIDRNNKQISVAGTTVLYTDLTHFIGLTELTLSVDDRIEISGYLDANQMFVATYIELDDDADNDLYEYTSGIISNLNTAEQVFSLQNLRIDYSEIGSLNLNNGSKVNVEGRIVDGILIAAEVEAVSDNYYQSLSSDEISRVEIEGVITAYNQATNSITINGLNYTLAENVILENMSVISVQEFVEIYIDPTNDVVTKIQSKNEFVTQDGKIKGMIEALDASTQTLIINGIEYVFTAQTRVEDESDRYFDFTSLNLNDRVEIVYSLDAQGQFVILRIERESEREYEEEWELEGYVTSFDAASRNVVLNGMSVTLPDSVKFVIDDMLTDIDGFFNALTSLNNMKIEIAGAYDVSGNFFVNKVELESTTQSSDDDDSNDDGHSNDNDNNGIGYVELEGKITAILSENSFTLNGREVRIDFNTELELNDRNVNVEQFMAALSVGTRVEIEGTWMDSTYIYAFEAEIENDDD